MRTLLIGAVIFGSLVLALSAVAGTIFIVIRILRGGLSREEREILSEETRMIQDIYQGLSKMERRLDTLETILLDRERKEREE
ncbi:phage-shock protein [Desulfonema magnum]|uniref:Phage-shock protein n=1 Tax=Desulfonema magnum TaxID=45655 RepID=A0A975BVM5_9BACT|nr:phage-shock protein [Desulfonema magnum]QTA92645.1 Uncharacterized protein dnm_087320 [Desulfonema magnum]